MERPINIEGNPYRQIVLFFFRYVFSLYIYNNNKIIALMKRILLTLIIVLLSHGTIFAQDIFLILR